MFTNLFLTISFFIQYAASFISFFVLFWERTKHKQKVKQMIAWKQNSVPKNCEVPWYWVLLSCNHFMKTWWCWARYSTIALHCIARKYYNLDHITLTYRITIMIMQSRTDIGQSRYSNEIISDTHFLLNCIIELGKLQQLTFAKPQRSVPFSQTIFIWVTTLNCFITNQKVTLIAIYWQHWPVICLWKTLKLSVGRRGLRRACDHCRLKLNKL